MAFTIVDKQPGGGTGEISIGQAGEATEVWTVVADTVGYSTENLRYAGLWGTPYETYHAQNSRLLLRPVKITQNDDNPALFICTLTWTSEPLTPEEKEQKENSPLDRKARIKVKSGRMKECKHKDFYGKPKCNTAGDLFDPPIESNSKYLILNIRKYVTVFPDWMFNYDDCVNASPFVIKGRLIEKGCAYIANIELGEENTDGLIPYCEALVEMWIKKRRKPAAGENPNSVPDPWETEQLNAGLHERGDAILFTDPVQYRKVRAKVKDDNNEDVYAAAPVPLDKDGKKLNPTATLDNAHYVVFRDHEELEFSAISYLWSNA